MSVADTGPGIPSSDQAKIFEEFQQVDSSSTRRRAAPGSGSPSPSASSSCTAGSIWVDSSSGQGSTFRFTGAGRGRSEQAGGDMAKRILIVEDHEDNRQILRDLLTYTGYDMVEAENGSDGVRPAGGSARI